MHLNARHVSVLSDQHVLLDGACCCCVAELHLLLRDCHRERRLSPAEGIRPHTHSSKYCQCQCCALSSTICLSRLSCSAIVLERGRPRRRLESWTWTTRTFRRCHRLWRRWPSASRDQWLSDTVRNKQHAFFRSQICLFSMILVGIDIPGWVSGSNSKSNAIKVMSDKMRAMGRRKK